MSPLEILLRPLGKAMRARRADESLSVTHRPELQTEQCLDVTSTSFADGEVIPDRCCGTGIGSNTSPQVGWSPVPEGTAGMLLIIEDIDVPTKSPSVHTAVSFPADRTELAEGELTPRGKLTPQGKGFSYLHHRPGPAHYFGPQPLPGHGPHHYRFHLYATDVVLDLSGPRSLDQLASTAAGHVLAAGMLEGTRESR